MCHCISAPPQSGTSSSVYDCGSMYIADTSRRDPSGCGSYTRLSGWSGSRKTSSSIQSHWMKCSCPVAPSPIERKPAASATAGSDHCGSSLERVGDEVLGERLLLGADTGRARQVDGERGGVRHGDRRGGGIAVVVLAGRDAVRSRRSVGAVVVAGRALVGSRRVVGGLAGAVALEGGERPARVGCDPHVDHRVAAAGVHRTGRAVAVGVAHAHHLRAVGAAGPAQVEVDVPLHQRPAVADDRGVVDGDSVGDVHRRHERALVAVDAIDERLRRGGIEELVVADVRVVDVVLVTGRGVTDRLEAERSHRGHIGEARQVLLRAPDQRGGAELLGPRHAGDARHVDRLGRVVRPRPVQSDGRDRPGRRRRPSSVVAWLCPSVASGASNAASSWVCPAASP